MVQVNAKLLVASCTKETGALLKEYLTARGIGLTKDAKKVISYGVSQAGALNGNCGRGKMFNMRTMLECGVRTVPFYTPTDRIPTEAYPLLARQNHGFGGTDIVPVFQSEELQWRVRAGWEWFSQYIPLVAEYRVWVFRGEVLDTYQKQMNRPEEYKFIGRNFRNGFDFVHSANEQDASDACIKAVKVLDLDFAAVDCIRGKDERIYVLETNTAPGVIRSGAQATLGKLADRMVEWVRA